MADPKVLWNKATRARRAMRVETLGEGSGRNGGERFSSGNGGGALRRTFVALGAPLLASLLCCADEQWLDTFAATSWHSRFALGAFYAFSAQGLVTCQASSCAEWLRLNV